MTILILNENGAKVGENTPKLKFGRNVDNDVLKSKS